ncbi:hypothetical protein [Paenibacillus sp. FSL L8-0709]|uniref:hypothetical protein n=1 Tax=Paenibacillus sp. FSL L8-0709 TaxID=2975312 RepID=UPI0030FB0760
MGDTVSKTIINIAERETAALYKIYCTLMKMYPREDATKSMESDFFRSAKKMIKAKTLSLTTVYNKVFQEYNALTKQINDMERANSDVGEETYASQINLSLQMKLFEKAIEMKKIENQKAPKHPVENNLLEHGYFGAVTPTKATIKAKWKTGVIQQQRNGFRAIYYENDRGEFLTSYDTRVFIGLFRLWLDQGKPEIVSFEFSDLAKVLEMDSNGGDYIRIYESLLTISRTQITMMECYDPTNKISRRTIHHHPLNTLEFIARQGEEPGRERAAEITFHEILQANLLAGNYLLINMVLYNDLQKPISKTLYLTLMNAVHKGVRSFEVDRLCEHLNLQTTSNRTQTVTALVEAFQELKDISVLSSFETITGARRSLKFIEFEPSDWVIKQNQSQLSSMHESVSDSYGVQQLTFPMS